MIKVYGIPNCNTVKKAIDWLKQNKLDFEFHDYKKKGISKEKLQEWSKHFGWENILNKKGTTWAKLSEEEKDKRRVALDKKETELMRMRRMRISVKSFESIKIIGRGAFGEVC